MKKKRITILVFFSFLLLFLVSCKHTHTYSKEWTIDMEATCITEGSKSHHCLECDAKTDITPISAIGHSYGEWITTKEPTELTPGLQERECSVCHYKETNPIPVLSHTHTFSKEWTIDMEATCIMEGSKSHHCLECDAKTDITPISALGHSYREWITTKEPTELTPGLQERECSVCHYKETNPIPVLSHTHTFSKEWTIDMEATCTETGSKSHHCLECDAKTDITSIPVLDHNFENWTVTVEPSLSSRGLLTRFCKSNSNHKETYVMPILNKIDYSYYLVDSPLCDKNGLEKYILIKDGDVFEFATEVKALGHSYGEWIATKEATEEVEGTRERECSTCHNIEVESLPILEHIHAYSTSWTIDKDATCLEEGSKSHHCLECNAKTDITSIPALGHSFENWTVKVNPDNTSYGLLTRICSINSSHKETCLLPEFNKSDYRYILEKSPLCDENGLEKYVFIKDGDIFEFTKEIESTGHLFGEWITTKKPTEEAEGTRERECRVCHIKVAQTLPLLEHIHRYSSEWIIDKAATCTEEGSKSYHCLSCDERKDITVIPVVAHNFGEWITTKEATETVEGARERECNVCHLKEKDVVPVLTHTHIYSKEWTIDMEATCTETGSKSHHCLGCNYKEDITSIPAKGHNFGNWILTTEPTFTTYGLLTQVCSNDSNHKNTFILPKLNQQNYRYQLLQKSLCDTKGIEKYSFTMNDDIFEFTIELEELGHDFGRWEVTIEPSLTSTGLLTRVCSRDGNHKETFVLPALNKDTYTYRLVSEGTCIRPSSENYEYIIDNQTFKFYFSQYGSHSVGVNLYYNESTHWAICRVCGGKVEASHDFIDDDCFNCNYNKILGTKGLIYKENNTHEYIVRKGTVQDLTIIIPEEYNSLPVVSISSFSSSSIVSIVIPKSVTSVTNNAFYDCRKLTNVYYEGSIEDWCSINFGNDSSNPMAYANHFYLRNSNNEWEEITSIVIPESVTSVTNNAFYGFNNLTNVYYEGSIEDWCSICFDDYDSNPMVYANHFYLRNNNNEWEEVTSIVIPNTISEIGENQFYGFKNVTSITLPKSLSKIKNESFKKCDKLVNVYYEGTIEEWSTISFGNDSSNPMAYANHFYLRNSNDEWEEATSIVISKNVTSVTNNAFYNFNNLTNVYYEGTIEEWSTISFGNDSSNPMAYANHFYLRNSNDEWEEVTSIVIPESVTSIKEYAFYGFNNLINVYYEGTLEDWCNIEFTGYKVTGNPMLYASHFYLRNSDNEWEEVIDIEIPETITKIGHAQFTGFNISILTIPKNVEIIDAVAFYNCENLSKVILQDGVVELGRSAFANCSNLTSVFLPKSLNQFGMTLFDKCDILKSIYYEGSIEDWCNIKFKNVATNPMFYTSHFYLRNSNGAWEELTHLKLPQTLTAIGNHQFAKFSNIFAITIPASIEKIGLTAFWGCEALTSVYYEGNIEDWLQIDFMSSSSNPMLYASHLFVLDQNGEWDEVKEIKIPSNLTKIVGNAYHGYTESIYIIIPNTIEHIHTNSFEDCKAIILCETSQINTTWETTFNNNKVAYYWYSESEPTSLGNWWHYVDGIPEIWS